MNNPYNNSVPDYCKSLFLKIDEMASPLNPEGHTEIQFEILVSVPLKSLGSSNTSDTMKWYIGIYCIYSSHVITPLVNSLMYSYVMHRQVKEMDTLNLFIESH